MAPTLRSLALPASSRHEARGSIETPFSVNDHLKYTLAVHAIWMLLPCRVNWDVAI